MLVLIAVPLQSVTLKRIEQSGTKLICPHQFGDSCDYVVIPDVRTHWFSGPLTVHPMEPLLSRGQRGKPVMVVLPCHEAQKLAWFLKLPKRIFGAFT